MMAVLERLSAQMSQLQSEIEASKGREAELRSQVRNQDLIIGLLRDDLGRSAARVDDKFTETMAKLSSGVESLSTIMKESQSSRTGLIDTKGIGKPTVFSLSLIHI